MVTCPICEKQMNYINSPHLKTHNMTPSQFKANYPNFIALSTEASKNLSRRGNPNFIKYKEKQSEKVKLETLNNFKLLDKRCKKCSEKIAFKKRKNMFCSHSCAASFVRTKRKKVYSKDALLIMQENGRKNTSNLTENRKPKGKFINTCKICLNSFETSSSTKLKKTCSKECLKSYRSKYNAAQGSHSKSGHYKGIYCASTWELAFLIFHLDKGSNIKRCDLTFPYQFNNEPHTYFPDFMIDNEIYEIKGRELGDVEHKTKAVVESGYKIHMIRRSNIAPFIAYVKEQYRVKDLTSLYE